MIGFFRRIRKKLADDNQFVKYSRYAIGEILLVVIGILIALSINNWNTSKNDNQIIQNFMENIGSNIREDLLQIDFLKEKRKDAKRLFPKIVKDLSNKLIVNVDTLSSGMALAFTDYQLISNRGGFSSVMNSGFIEKVPFDITERLYRYYFLVDELKRVEVKYNLFCEEMESKIHLEKGVLSGLIKITGGEQRINVPLENYLLVAPLDAIFVRGPYDIGEILGLYSQIEVQGKAVLTEIQEKYLADSDSSRNSELSKSK